jgi:hypothetical protein
MASRAVLFYMISVYEEIRLRSSAESVLLTIITSKNTLNVKHVNLKEGEGK